MAILVRRASLLSLILLPLLMSAHSNADEEFPLVRLLTLNQIGSGWKTLLFVNEGELSGRFRDIIDCSFEHIPYRVSYDFGPFSRIQRQVEAGQADGYFPANLTKERLRYAAPSSPLIDDHKVLIRDAEKPLTREIRVAAMRGASQELAVARSLSDFVFPINNYNQLISMLNAGRIDAIVGSKLFFSVTEEFDKIDQRFIIQRLDSSPMRAFFGNYFLKNNPKFLNLFNRALKSCMQPRSAAESDQSLSAQ